MQVTLLSYTPDALDILLMTKETRLSFDPGRLEEIRQWPLAQKLKEWEYMKGTIQSSWEFVDYIFMITGVSRAFTHQFVRTRANSYAQQSQRTVDMSEFEAVPTPAILASEHKKDYFDHAMGRVQVLYQLLRDEGGFDPQDARAILPEATATGICVKTNLRTLSDTAKLRLCYRAQGEYQEVFREMRARVIEVHPWAEPVIRVHCAATGVCAFPNFAECPIKPAVYNPDTGERWDGAVVERAHTILSYPDGHPMPYGPLQHSCTFPARPATREEIQRKWEQTRFEAVPKETKR
jgi:flavin-dependent thymidylate synthase